MRRVLALLPLLLPATSVASQSAGEPTVFLSAYGGLSGGHHLWRVNQPLCVWMTVIGGYQCEQGPSGPINDTLTLSRQITVGFNLGLGLAKYLTPHVGVRVDLWYAEESIQDRCTPLDGFQPDSDQKNLQTCNHVTADNQSLSLVGLSGNVLLRPLPQASMSPYLRAGIGVVIPTGETLAASGDFFANGHDLSRQVIEDSSGQGPRGYGVLALGVQTGSGGGSRFQFEVSDAIVAIDRLKGPADVNGRAPRVRAMTNNFSLTLGIAVLFSERRGRRY